ncbi:MULTISPECIES: MerR family transcriptional regulator [unclassified Duganella]|uniref:MerR family transcriptional regulator n=1 Tax=unclassified Duganella TaxID=2636909 RepID=UPI000881E21E|nr:MULTISPECIES: MerR family transcriptional regulator [unclassified Duganella]SDG00452.1 DNA-binding transcriptional regulator, MerR family [Duganella sp. OV458]SDJ04575.1 transcriptional regulator, MerR family [Duganella sp. OV510]
MEKTVLKIGALAARSGLTVRALHHYDDIGLLKPSARADSGYRLYNRDDVERLHKIQALRKFGMSLADIATFLASPDAPFADVVSQQIAALDQQIKQASTLREQLTRLQQQMNSDHAPALESWIGALEHMKLYEQYFTPEELKRLPFWQQEARRNAVWRGMVDEVKTLIAHGVPFSSAEAGALALRWMETLEHDTAANPEFARRMTIMMQDDRLSQRHSPIPQDVQQYIGESFNERKMTLYAKYLNAEEMQYIRVNSRKYFHEWLALLVKVHAQMESGVAANHPEMQALAREWMRLFRARAGSHPDTQSRIRLAHESEPELLKGTWVSPATLAYIRQAVAACEQA